MVLRGPTNPVLIGQIEDLKKEKKEIWQKTAEMLSRPTRNRPAVNLSKIDRYTKEGEVVLVPGKVLASGSLSKPVTVAAWNFSESARKKILGAKGKALSISELKKANPKGSGVRVMA